MIAHRWQATVADAQNPAYAGNDDFFLHRKLKPLKVHEPEGYA